MIHKLIGFAVAGVLMASPAMAAERNVELSGKGEFIATYLRFDDRGKDVIQGGEATDYWTLGGSGAFDAAWGNLNLQTDFSAEGVLEKNSDDDTLEHWYGGGLHVGWRDPKFGSVSGFAGIGKVKINNLGDDDPDTIAWTAGLEGQLFFDPVTLYLQGGYMDRQSIASGGDVAYIKNAGFVRVVPRVFVGDNFKIEPLKLSYTEGTMDPDRDNVWILGWGAELEYRLENLPVSAFLSYDGARYDQEDDWDVLYEHRIGFGVRLYFGQESLKTNDRHGASLELPPYLKWGAVTAGTLE